MYNFIINIRAAILVFLTHRMALPLLKIVRKPEIFPYSVKQLQQFETGSLGNDLFNFIEEKDLELLPYYARHDMKHILLRYDTTYDGEVCLQSFMLGNGHISFPVIATVLYGFITMPEHWKKFWSAYNRGKTATPLQNWKWFDMLTQPTEALRKSIFI